MAPPQPPYLPTSSIHVIAQSIPGISQVNEDASKLLAHNAEDQLKSIVHSALSVMRHSRRSCLDPSHINAALKQHGLPLIWGYERRDRNVQFSPVASDGVYILRDPVYALEDVLNQKVPTRMWNVQIQGEWIAWCGDYVPSDRDDFDLDEDLPNTNSHPQQSRPLGTVPFDIDAFQKWYEAISQVVAIGTDDQAAELTQEIANTSTSDFRIQLPVFVQLVCRHVILGVADYHVDRLCRCLKVVQALIDYPYFGIESYVQSLLPPVLTCLLSSRLCSAASNAISSENTEFDVRLAAVSVLAQLVAMCNQVSEVRPRVFKTLVSALLGATPTFLLGVVHGALEGLAVLGGKELVYTIGVHYASVLGQLQRYSKQLHVDPSQNTAHAAQRRLQVIPVYMALYHALLAAKACQSNMAPSELRIALPEPSLVYMALYSEFGESASVYMDQFSPSSANLSPVHSESTTGRLSTASRPVPSSMKKPASRIVSSVDNQNMDSAAATSFVDLVI